MNEFHYVVTPENIGNRIDKWVSQENTSITRSSIQKLIDSGNILVNDKQVSKNYKLRLNDKIYIMIPDPVELDVLPQNIPVEIVYEDDDLLVVNKPKGMVVHPAAGNPDGTLVNALL